MRVAMVLHTFAPDIGGAERQVQRLGPLLERRGVEVTVVTRRWLPRHPRWPARERQEGLDVRRVSAPRARVAGPCIWSTSAVATLGRLRPDVIHAHHLGSPTSIALVAGRLLRAPVVAKVLSTGPGGDFERLLAKPFGGLRLAAARTGVSAFVAVSADVERELAEHRVRPERVRRIANGVDAGRFRPARPGERAAVRDELGLPHDELVALFIGRLNATKRLDLLLDAWRRVPWRLVIAGTGPEESRLRLIASAEALRDRVTFLAGTDEPAPIYRAADVYVSASGTEGMSGSVLEAMATALPVAALPAAGMVELLASDVGAIASEDTPAALAATVSELAADPRRRERVGRAAREKVVADYSLESTADRLVALYGELRERTGGSS